MLGGKPFWLAQETYGSSSYHREKVRPIDGHQQILTTPHLYVDVQCQGRPQLVAVIGWRAIDRI